MPSRPLRRGPYKARFVTIARKSSELDWSEQMFELGTQQREFLRHIWREGRLSRWELHQRTDVNAKAVGIDIASLLKEGVLRECERAPLGPGRPRVPLEIDPAVRHVVGIAISPGTVECCRLNLRGELIGKIAVRKVTDVGQIVSTTEQLLRDALNDRSLAIGLSSTGMIDPAQPVVLGSSVSVGRGSMSLMPLFDIAGQRPLVLENDMHALAARWMLTHQAGANEDVLMALLQDGQMGAALLIDGRPNRGCAIGANELGHMRFFVDTEVCYCGHPGCLERVCSTPFLQKLDGGEATLLQRAARYDGTDTALNTVIDYVSAGLANVANFVRPNRMVIVSELTRYPVFYDALMRRIRSRLLVDLVDRVRIELWDQPRAQSAETAAWLALADLYYEGWNRAR